MRESYLQMAERHVRRSAQLLEAQLQRVYAYEQRGWDSERARVLLRTMCKALRMMIEHREVIRGEEEVLAVARHNHLVWPLRPKALVRRRHSPVKRWASTSFTLLRSLVQAP